MGPVIRFRAAALAVAGMLLCATGAAAEGVALEQGEWRIEQITRTPVQPEPQLRVTETCISGSSFTPDRLVTEEHGTCDVSDVRVEGDTMTWAIDCPEAESSGTGEFTSDGLTAHGQMQMRVRFQDRDMSFTVEWNAQHVGSC